MNSIDSKPDSTHINKLQETIKVSPGLIGKSMYINTTGKTPGVQTDYDVQIDPLILTVINISENRYIKDQEIISENRYIKDQEILCIESERIKSYIKVSVSD